MNRWIRTFRGTEIAGDAPGRPAVPDEASAATARDAGDEARDRRDWHAAVTAYRRHLATSPADGAIWMQLGHACKETADFDGAETAYRTAETLRPDDADVPLQIGHLMKLAGRRRDAAAAYAAALAKLPSSDAYGELVRMGRGAMADRLIAEKTGTGTIYLQITDLLNFLRVHRTPSGIQRVQLGILECQLDEGNHAGRRIVEFVVNRPNDTRVWKAPRRALAVLVEQLRAVEVDHDGMRAAAEEIFASAILVNPGRQDLFVVLGAFWGRPDNATLLNALRQRGTAIGVYLYDVIPLTHPEYCDRQLVVDFTADFCETLQLVDFALTISEFTAEQVRGFLRANGFAEPPLAVVPLAHGLTGQDGSTFAEEANDLDWTGDIARLRDREFVLCVCTIEPRKNHRYLYDVWKALKDEGIAVPDLVFVGRRGWTVDDLFVQMRNSDWLGGTISIVHDLSDQQLATLYRSCLFTAFPSIVEGWGLPVGESLSHGRLCVSSGESSMREVGRDCALYIDPLNLRDGIATFRALILDRGRIAEWERRIRADFVPRGWTDVAHDFFTAVDTLAATPRRAEGEKPANLRPGSLLRLGRLSRGSLLRPIRDYAALERLALGDSFYPPEPMGAWMKGRTGTLQFRAGLAAGTPVVCYLVVKGAPNVESGDVTVSGSVAQHATCPLRANRTETLRLRGEVGPSGEMTVTLTFSGRCPPHHPDERDFCMALLAFGYADVGDPLGRAELLEELVVDNADLRVC